MNFIKIEIPLKKEDEKFILFKETEINSVPMVMNSYLYQIGIISIDNNYYIS